MDSFEDIGRRFFFKLLGAAAVTAASSSNAGCSSGGAGEGQAGADAVGTTNDAGYDYIVVGSGAGGGPLAANLARQGFQVLLLEAGEDHGALPNYQVPGWNAFAEEDAALRWDYFVRHYDDDAQQAKDSKATPAGVYYPRGGTLGGSTAVNALITIYPHASDFQHIADLTNDASWSPDNMRTYFTRMEHCDYLPAGTPGHGQAGWLHIDKARGVLPDQKLLALLSAAAVAFLQTNAPKTNIYQDFIGDIHKLMTAVSQDVNSASADRDTTEGLFTVPLTMTAGSRNGPREYILRVRSKYKLTVKMRALAAKVVFATPSSAGGVPVAIGVDYLDGTGMDAVTWKNTARYRADRDAPPNPQAAPPTVPARLKVGPDGNPRGEVIVACGAFNTPQLLKLSGVGPAAELTSLGIPVVVDLAGVGTNLQDRYEVTVVTQWSSDFEALNGCTFGQGSDYCYQVWQAGHAQGVSSGIYSTGPTVAMLARSAPQVPDPDLVIFGIPGDFRGYKLGLSTQLEADHRHFTWSILKAHTNNNAGTVTLRSTDPRDTPDIRFRYFQQGGDQDLAAVVKGVQIARQIGLATPAQLATGTDTSTFVEVSPGPNVATPEQVSDFVKNEAWGHHACGTCPIGPRESGGVLDSHFRVYGTQGLRVVDASIFPKIPGTFLAVPIYMVSEKAFDVIVADASQSVNLGAI